jgi:hypothetical protein
MKRNIGLTFPVGFYRKMEALRECADNKRNRVGQPIISDQVYRHYRKLMEQLSAWLSEQTEGMGYGIAFKIIGWTEYRGVILRRTNNPFDCFWTLFVIDHISEQFRFGGLLERWRKER